MADPEQIEQFLAALKSQKGFSANTLSAYRNDLSQFAEFIRSGAGPAQAPVTDWRGVTRDHIMLFILYLKERKYAQTTVARKQAAIKSFFKYLVSKGTVPASPAEELASPQVDRALPHTISTTDADRLLAELYRAPETPEVLRDRAMMQLLYATGLRVGEMVALDLANVDAGAGTVSTVARGKERRVPLNSELVADALREYLEKGRPPLAKLANQGASLAHSSEDALFLNHRGQRLTRQGFWLILKRYARLAGLGEVSPHTLRHSFAAQKLKSGADVRDLQRMLGHANVSTTQVYARLGQANSTKSSRGEAGQGRPKKVAS